MPTLDLGSLKKGSLKALADSIDEMEQMEDDPDKVDESNEILIQKSQLEAPAEVKPKFNLAASLQMIKKARAQGKFE